MPRFMESAFFGRQDIPPAREIEHEDKYIVTLAQNVVKIRNEVQEEIKKLINGEEKILIFPKGTELLRIRNGVIEKIL